MTSRYRVEYALKSHRRDEFIEWIKALLAVPFVLHADIENQDTPGKNFSAEDVMHHEMSVESDCRERYSEVFKDVGKLIDNTILLDSRHLAVDPEYRLMSRLRQLVPGVGKFYTSLPLNEAFLIEDKKRLISRRRMVSPSFNDVRRILNTAQVLALTREDSHLKLITFDGDVTLYEDGKSLLEDLPLVQCILGLLSHDVFVAVVTAAGYPDQNGAEEYRKRLPGLIAALSNSDTLTDYQKENFLVMGGESNYLFRYLVAKKGLTFIPGQEWYLPIMRQWDQSTITSIMDVCFEHVTHLRQKLRLGDDSHTTVIRKERSLGIIPRPGFRIPRETLEEIVLLLLNKVTQLLEIHAALNVRVCAFNGGADVWVDIGDKSLGVLALQLYLCHLEQPNGVCPIRKSETLHIGDQFASVGANDFKARLAACTAWIASPRETKEILDELLANMGEKAKGGSYINRPGD